jgi:hypothetical protein
MAEYYFSLPPLQTDNPNVGLNPAQYAAVIDENPIALSGGPGTGKSVVSLWRHILNHQRANPVRSQLLTYTTSLALYLRKCCHTKNLNASNYVDSSKNWVYNNAYHRAEIIHDEAQDLPLEFNQRLRNYSNKISYGADDRQLITSDARNPDGSFNLDRCSPEENLRAEFANNSSHELSKNYRNSKKILKLAKRLFSHLPEGPSIPQEFIDSCPIEGEYPRLIVTGNNANNVDISVLQLVGDFAGNETMNIGILVPFESPNALAGETATVDHFYDLLTTNGHDCSKFTNRMGRAQEIKNIHVTTFKSAKGLEFDVVIIPDFNLVYIAFRVVGWRDFYVGVTRTKSNLFLISRSDFPNLPANGINQIIEKVIL